MAKKIKVTLPRLPRMENAVNELSLNLSMQGYFVDVLDFTTGDMEITAGGGTVDGALPDSLVQDIRNRGGSVEFYN